MERVKKLGILRVSKQGPRTGSSYLVGLYLGAGVKTTPDAPARLLTSPETLRFCTTPIVVIDR